MQSQIRIAERVLDIGVDAAACELPRVSVLLVDDHPENLLALEASLEPLGQRLVRAESGTAALRAVLDEQFAVILMDVRMPDLDGFETMALLRQRERSRNVPIIFLSAHPEKHHVLRSYSSGAVDYLLKPFDPDALRSKVSVFVTLRQNELALQAAHSELQTAHAELEHRVQKRTAELAAANKTLEREVAERKAVQQLLFDQAHHDNLTGLANRALLMEHLNRAVARSRRRAAPSFAVMMLDLDRFKVVNDTLGHLAGDQLLKTVAERLQGCLREVDTASRLGGDEFAILVDGITSLEDATRTAERIQHALAVPLVVDHKEVFATASIGIAMMDARYKCGEELLRDADTALYRAKEAGRAQFQVFDREMHTSVMKQLGLEADLLARSSAASSSFTTSRSSLSIPARSSASRRWSAGTIRSAGSSAPASSSRSPRTAGSSDHSATGCSKKRRARPPRGCPTTLP
ncbi:MAG: diguanylate cyclase [Deltaproteobacteria bacterium]|nr:diguanylate cyclase [Deltaproteobacteria bacterium]